MFRIYLVAFLNALNVWMHYARISCISPCISDYVMNVLEMR